MALDVLSLVMANSYTSSSLEAAGALKGNDGVDGKTYAPSIGTVVSGTAASASVEIDEENLTAKFNFTLPKGADGSDGVDGTDGVDGQDGISPTIVEDSANTEDVYKLKITDKNGTITTPNLMGSIAINTVELFNGNSKSVQLNENIMSFSYIDVEVCIGRNINLSNVGGYGTIKIPIGSNLSKKEFSVVLARSDVPEYIFTATCIIDENYLLNLTGIGFVHNSTYNDRLSVSGYSIRRVTAYKSVEV